MTNLSNECFKEIQLIVEIPKGVEQ